jgi:aspartyl-tRNA(Asn)/glutamyl-tRNA(Gln) amidotransferase subunit A
MQMPATMVDAAEALRAGHLTAENLVTLSADAIAAHDADTHAFIRVDIEAALVAARRADEERAAGFVRGPLHGLPLSLKDLIDVEGQPTTSASRVRAGRVAWADAPVVARLREAGAVFIGKTNLHEFALGTTSEDSAYGPVLHPADLTRSAGGSSGGSAVAVATGMGLASVGTDTGGSIRIPAAACGIVGLKPALGDVPGTGIMPLSVTLDHVGTLTKSVQDAAWLWSILAGRPVHTIVPVSAHGLRVGVLGGYFSHPVDPIVANAFARAVEQLQSAGSTLVPVTFDLAPRITDTYVNLVLPEGAHVHAAWLDTYQSEYSPAVYDRLMTGRTIPAIAYLQARHQRAVLRAAVDALFSSVDVLILPTLPIVAPVSGQANVMIGDTELPVRVAMLKHTQLFNLTGHPAISLPLTTGGLPAGLQVVGPSASTPRLLNIAAAFEAVVCQSPTSR